MPLYVKDAEADRMAGRLAALQRTSKAEAVRRALRRALESEQGEETVVERGVAFTRALLAHANPEAAGPADKKFIDGLYGDG